jgi:hypothetical protein
MNISLQSRTRSNSTTVRRRSIPATAQTSAESDEAVNVWYGIGLPLLTFCFWLAGLILLHPWAGFLLGLALSFFIGARLMRAAPPDDLSRR